MGIHYFIYCGFWLLADIFYACNDANFSTILAQYHLHIYGQFMNSHGNLLMHAIMQGVAITQENSLLDNTARIEGWLARFPMFDWVGGRTSVMSAVGLLPAALQVIGLKSKFSLLLL